MCPASLPQTGAQDPPCAQHPCLRQMSLKHSQCNNVLTREEECVFKFPHKSQRPRGQRPTIGSLQSLRGGGGSRVETARFGGGDSRNRRKNGSLEKQKVPRCVQGEALQAGAVGQLVVRILLATVPGLGMSSRECQHKGPSRTSLSSGRGCDGVRVQAPWDKWEGFPEEGV